MDFAPEANPTAKQELEANDLLPIDLPSALYAQNTEVYNEVPYAYNDLPPPIEGSVFLALIQTYII